MWSIFSSQGRLALASRRSARKSQRRKLDHAGRQNLRAARKTSDPSTPAQGSPPYRGSY